MVRVTYLENAVTYANHGSIQMQGMEAEAQVRLVKKMTLFTSVAYQTNKNNEVETDVTAIANRMVKGGVIYELSSHINLGVYNSYFSKPADVINAQSEIETAKQRRIMNPVPAAFHLLSLQMSRNLIYIGKCTPP